MMKELMIEWLQEVCHRKPGALIKKRRILVLDAFKSHLREKLKTVKQDLVNKQGGMTSQLEVLYMVVNKPFKDCLYVEWLYMGMSTNTSSKHKTI
jgi:hypothetical protein